MSILAEVKCARCDRKYSGLRSRCPYCGARRTGRGKYSEENDNSKAKMLVGILIMAVLVVAVVVLLLTTEKPDDGSLSEGPTQSGQSTNSPETPGPSSDIVSVPGLSTSPSVSSTPSVEPADPPPPVVEDVIITYAGKQNKDFTCYIGEVVPLKLKIEPPGIDLEELEIEWLSSNTSIFEVVEKSGSNGGEGKVTGLGKGDGTLTVRVNGVEATCTVRVRTKSS